MRKRIFKALTWFLGLLLVLGVGAYFFARSRSALSLIRRIAVQQLEAALGVTVQIGRLTGDPLRAVTAHNLRVAPDANAPHGALLWAERVRVQYRGSDLLRGKPFAETVQHAVASNFSLYLYRNAQGKWNWEPLFKPRPQGAMLPFYADLLLQNGVIHLRDEMSKDAQGRPLVQTFRVNRADADARSRRRNKVSDLVRIVADITGQPNSLRGVTVNGTMKRDGRDAKFTAQVNRFRPATWWAHAGRARWRLTGGVVDGTVRLTSPNLFASEPHLTLTSTLDLRSATVASSDLKRPLRNVNVRLTGSARFDGKKRLTVRGKVAGSSQGARRLVVNGQWLMVDGQSKATAEARFDGVDVRRWTDETIPSTTLIARSGEASGRLSVTVSPSQVSYTGEASLDDLTLSAKSLRAPLRNLRWDVALDGKVVMTDGTPLHSVPDYKPTGGTSLRSVPDYKLNCIMRGRDGSVRELKIAACFRPHEKKWDANVNVNDADLARLAAVVIPREQVRIVKGRLNGALTATWNAQRKRPLMVAGDVSLRDGAAFVSFEPRAITDTSARLTIAEDKVIVRAASGRWGKSLVSVDGRISRFANPVLDLNVASNKLNVRDLTALIAKSFQPPRLQTTDSGQLKGRLTGAWQRPDFVGTVAFPQTTVIVEQGEAVVPPMVASVSVRNVVNPQFDVRASFADVDVSRLKLTEGETKLEIPAPIQGRLTVAGTAQRVRVTAEAQLPQVRVQNVALSQVDVSVTYSDNALRISRLSAMAGGGTVTSSGIVRFVQPQSVVQFDVTLNDVSIGELVTEEQTGIRELNGRLSGSVAMSGPLNNIAVRCPRLALRDARGASEDVAWQVAAAEVTAMQGYVRVENGTASLLDAQARVAGSNGQVRIGKETPRTVAIPEAKGDVALHDGAWSIGRVSVDALGGRLTADVVRYDIETHQVAGTVLASGLDLQQLVALFDAETEPGKVNATAELSGTTERLITRLSVPELNLPNAPLSQTNALVVYHDQRLDVSELKTNVAGGTFTGQGGVNLTESPPTLNLEGQAANVQLATWQSLWREQNLTLSGIASGKLLAHGSTQNLTARTDLTIADFAGANVPKKDETPVQWHFNHLMVNGQWSMVNGETEKQGTGHWSLVTGHWSLDEGTLRVGSTHSVASSLRTFAVRAVTATASFENGNLNVKTVSAQTLGGAVSGQALSYNVDSGKIAGSVSVRDLDIWELGQAMKWEGAHLHGGTLNAENVSVTGTLEDPTFKGGLTLVDAEVSDVPIDRAQASFTASRHAVIVENGRCAVLGATFRVAGRIEEIDWEKQDARLNVTLTGDDIQVTDLARRIDLPIEGEGVARLTAQVGGTWKEPFATLSARVTESRLGDAPLEVTLDARLEEHVLSITQGYIRALSRDGDGAGFHILKGTVDTRPDGKVDVTFSGKDIPLQWVVMATRMEGMEKRVRGVFDVVEGTLSGTWEKPTGSAQIVVRNPSVDGEALPDVRGRLTLGNRVIQLKDFRAVGSSALRRDYEQATATVNGTIDLDGNLNVTLKASDLSVRWVKPFLPNAPELDGSARLTLTAQGKTDSPDVSGTVDVADLTIGDFKFHRLHVEPFVVTHNALVIKPGALRLTHRAEDGKEHNLTASGTIPIVWSPFSLNRTAPLRVDADIKDGDLSLITLFVPAVSEVSGALNASLRIAGTIDSPDLTGSASVRDGKLTIPALGEGIQQLQGDVLLPEGTRTITLQGVRGRIHPKSEIRNPKSEIRLTDGDFTFSGDIGLPPALDDPPSDYVYRLALRVNGAPVAPPDFSPLSRVSGDVVLVTDPNDRRLELRVHELNGRGAEGEGTFRINGSVKFHRDAWRSLSQYVRDPKRKDETLTPLTSSDFNLDVETTDLPLAHKRWGGGVLNSHFTLRTVPSGPPRRLFWFTQPPPSKPRLQGTLTVAKGALKVLAALPGETQLPDFPTLDVTLGVNGRVQVSNPILSAPFEQGQLRLRGTPRFVELQQVEDFVAYGGRLRLPRTDARIREAHIRVQGRTDPFFETFEPLVIVDAQAEARVAGYDIIIAYGPAPLLLGTTMVQGDPLRLSSDPPLPRDQIYTLLMGISPEGVLGVPTAGQLGQAFSQQLFGLATAQASSALSRAMERITGFDLFNITLRESGGLTFDVKKQFGRFALGARQDVARSGRLLFRAEYAPSRKWIFQWEQTQQEETMFKVGVRWRF